MIQVKQLKMSWNKNINLEPRHSEPKISNQVRSHFYFLLKREKYYKIFDDYETKSASLHRINTDLSG